MATYVYKCTDCDLPYEFSRGISDPEPKYECTDCGSTLTRVFQAPGVTFNGSGFYRTDK